MVRIVLEYLDHKTKDLQESNCMIKIAMKLVKCCLCLLEKVIKYISKNAYIVVAMKGTSFCSSTMTAFKLIFVNILQIGICASISSFMIFLGRLVVANGCAFLFYLAIESNAKYQQGGLEELNEPMIPVFVCGMVAYFVSGSFMGVYGMCIDTLLLCYCEDKAENKEGTYFMSDRLLKAINVSTSHAKEEEEEAGKDAAPPANVEEQLEKA